MYTSFYKLHSKPFQISSDPAFMWFGEKHKEALATLKYGILDNKGFLLLTGDVGTGKTSLINSLVQSLNEDIICTTVPDPSLDKMDFLNYIAAAFGMGREFLAKGTFLAHFREFLLEANEKGKKVLLIIDEAQLLSQEMLEEIRLLSNIEKADAKLINIFFIGQNEFNEILNRPQNRAVRQRLTLNYNLEPLTPDETEAYIRHRLKVAGTTEIIFGRSATQEVFMYSGGFPRRINILCDHSLLSGYVKEQKIIDGTIVRECAKELKIPSYVRNRDINGFAKPKPVPPSKQEQSPSRPVPPPRRDIPVKPPISQESNQNRSPWGWVATLVFFFIFIWIFMFPNHFKNTVSTAGQRFQMVKDTIVPILPDSLKSYIGNPGSDYKEIPLQESSGPTPAPDRQETQKYIQQSNIEKKPDSHDPNRTEEQNPDPSGENQADTDSLAPDKNRVLIKPIQEKIVQDIQKNDPRPFSEDLDLNVKDKITEAIAVGNPSQKVYQSSELQQPGLKKILPLPKKKVIVRFNYNTNDFTPKGLKQLEVFSKIMTMHPEAQIMITGYTDSQGYAKYNKKLSEFRANIVKSFLLGKGIRQNQIQIQGLGGKNPIETNTTAWGRRMNRRVEIEVIE